MIALNVIKGLQLIEQYRPENGHVFHIRAEHDTIYAGDLNWPMSPIDADQLLFLGWERDENANGWRANV